MGESWTVVCQGSESLVNVLAGMLRDDHVDVRGRGSAQVPGLTAPSRAERHDRNRRQDRDELDDWIRAVGGATDLAEGLPSAEAVTLICAGAYDAVAAAVIRFRDEYGERAHVTIEVPPETIELEQRSPRHAK